MNVTLTRAQTDAITRDLASADPARTVQDQVQEWVSHLAEARAAHYRAQAPADVVAAIRKVPAADRAAGLDLLGLVEVDGEIQRKEPEPEPDR